MLVSLYRIWSGLGLVWDTTADGLAPLEDVESEGSQRALSPLPFNLNEEGNYSTSCATRLVVDVLMEMRAASRFGGSQLAVSSSNDRCHHDHHVASITEVGDSAGS